MRPLLRLAACLALTATIATSLHAAVVYDYQSTLSNNVTVVGEVTVDDGHPNYVAGGHLSWGNGILAFKFTASNGSITEYIDSQNAPPPQSFDLWFSSTQFPNIEWHDFSVFGTGYNTAYISVRESGNPGFDQWPQYSQLSGSSSPSRAVWSFRGPVGTRPSTWGVVKAMYR